jgi:SAM-dependent methyltransferase
MTTTVLDLPRRDALRENGHSAGGVARRRRLFGRRVLSWLLTPVRSLIRRHFVKNRYAVMFAYVRGYYISAAVYVAARLGIADLLQDGPKSAAELAVATGADERTLYRILRALAGARVFRATEDGRFALTRLGRLLHSDEPASLRDLSIYCGEIEFPVLPAFLESVRTGRNCVELTHGRSLWNVLADDTALGAVFDREMARTTEKHAPEIAQAWDFSQYKTVLDVGGGRGALLGEILRAHPATRGVLFDRPEVVGGARERLAALGLDGRCECVGGSFLEAVPPGADAYLIKHVLHDWNDGHVLDVLRNIRRAMSPGSRLLIIEGLVGENHVRGVRFFMEWQDLLQLVVTEGRERTRAEFADLLGQAGLRLKSVLPTSIVDVLILEAVPIEWPGE